MRRAPRLFAGLLAGLAASPAIAAPQKAAVAITGIDVESKDAETVALRVRAALAKRSDVTLISPTEEEYYLRSARPKQRRSHANLRAAEKYVKQAQSSFQAFDLGEAQKSVQKAKTMLLDWLGTKDAVAIDRDRLQLQIAIAHAQRDDKSMKEALGEYAVRFPREPVPQGMWPPEVKKHLEQIEPAESVLNIRSEPKGLIFIDGREVGNAPIRLGALPEGTHRVEVFLPNYFTFDDQVDTSAGRETLLEVKLLPDLSGKLKKARLDRSYPQDLVDSIRILLQPLGVKLIVAAGLDADGKLVVRRVDLEQSSGGSFDNIKADNTPEGAALAVSQLFEQPERATSSSGGSSSSSSSGARSNIPLWAWVGGGVGAVTIGAGLVLRMVANGTHSEFDQRMGSLTQTQAYDLRDRAEGQANSGAALVGVGLAAILGIASWLLIDFIPSRRGS